MNDRGEDDCGRFGLEIIADLSDDTKENLFCSAIEEIPDVGYSNLRIKYDGLNWYLTMGIG